MSEGEHETLDPAEAPGPDDHQPPEEPPHGTDGGSGSLGPRVLRALPWVLVVLAIAVAATSTWGYWQVADLATHEQDREEIERVAGEFMVELTNWDAAQGMADTRERLREAGTERFAGEVDELFGSTEDLAGLAELEAASEGEVRRNFVQEIEQDRALALVVVTQRVTSQAAEEPEVSERYAEVELRRTSPAPGGGVGARLRQVFTGGPSASDWRVDAVELLVEAAPSQQSAAPEGAAPGQQEDS